MRTNMVSSTFAMALSTATLLFSNSPTANAKAVGIRRVPPIQMVENIDQVTFSHLQKQQPQSQQQPHTGPTTHIIGGSDSGKGQFPFAVHLTIHTTPTQGFYCVGSLITNSYVVTAAHCLTKAESSQKLNPADILVRYGGENVNSMQQARADQITVHDEWNPTNLHNDIALLRLSQPVAFGPNVQPARISRMSMTTPQTQVVALGWGQTTNDMMSASPTLKHVMIQTGDEMSCRRVMPEFTNSDANVVCTANTPGRDTCYGDSGGPLVTMETVRNDRSAEPTRVATLVGLTSFGDTASHSSHPLCGSGEIVAFYTHVAHYADWIAGITGVGRQMLMAQSVNEPMSTTSADGGAAGRGSGRKGIAEINSDDAASGNNGGDAARRGNDGAVDGMQPDGNSALVSSNSATYAMAAVAVVFASFF